MVTTDLPLRIGLGRQDFSVTAATVGNVTLQYDKGAYYLVIFSGTDKLTKAAIPIGQDDYRKLSYLGARYNEQLRTYPGKTVENERKLQVAIRGLFRRFNRTQINEISDTLSLKVGQLPITIIQDRRNNLVGSVSGVSDRSAVQCSVYFDDHGGRPHFWFVVSRNNSTSKTMVLINKKDFENIAEQIMRFREYSSDPAKSMDALLELRRLVTDLLKRFKPEDINHIKWIMDHPISTNIRKPERIPA